MGLNILMRVVYLPTGSPDFVNQYVLEFSANRDFIIYKDLRGRECQIPWDGITGLSVAAVSRDQVDLNTGDQ